MTSNTTSNKPQRLQSLDVLRGFDMACLVLIQPILYHFLEIAKPAEGTFGAFLYGQVTHVRWEGFCFWDIIMPLFMFMSGITIPFAFSRQKREGADASFYRRLLKRFLILWGVGMVVQGNLLALDWHQLHFYSNTLQSIAVGYVVTSLLFVLTSRRTQIAVVAACFIAYMAVFALWGNMDFTIGKNIAEAIDITILGVFRDGMNWNGTTWTVDPTYNYTWILSSLNFIVTVYLGCWAGYILKSTDTAKQKLQRLCIVGTALTVAALAMNPVFPIIKHIWSSSMTLFAGGICFLLMALFFYVVDMRGWNKGTQWLKYYGMNSLAAYFLGEYLNFRSIPNSLLYGLEQFLGEYYPVVGTAANVGIVYLIIRWMYKQGIFIKA
uniref:DUF5009 domain-containing protein n=1 Tax=Prevotella sp. GTC17262 TaxID=3236797 RepID=A0AB33JVF7_9BACT